MSELVTDEQSDWNPPFELGQPVFLKPDILGNIDIAIWIVVGHHRSFFGGYMVDCVAGDDCGHYVSIPAGLLTEDDPYKKIGRVLNHGKTSNGKTLLVLAGGLHG